MQKEAIRARSIKAQPLKIFRVCGISGADGGAAKSLQGSY